MGFLWLLLSSMLGIVLHELGHHLVGRASEMGLTRIYPLERVTPESRGRFAASALAGPGVTLALGCLGWLAGWPFLVRGCC